MADSIIKTLPRRELCPEIRPANAASLQSVIIVTFHLLRTGKISNIKKKQAMDCKRAYMIWRSTLSIMESPKDGIRTNKTTIKATAMTGTICLEPSLHISETYIIINNLKINQMRGRSWSMLEQSIFILARIDQPLKTLFPRQDSNNKEISSDHISILIMHSNNNNKNK